MSTRSVGSAPRDPLMPQASPPVPSGFRDVARSSEPAGFTYREYRPHPALAHHVQCYWSMGVEQPREAGLFNRGLSKGYVDLIFATGGAFCASAEQWLGENRDIRCYLVGPLPEAALAHSTGRVAAVGIRLKPGKAYPLLRTSCAKLVGCPAALRDVWPKTPSSYLEQVADAHEDLTRLRLLERLLLQRLDVRGTEDDCVRRALAIVTSTRGCTSVEELMAELHISARQLERKFHERVGVPPKRMSQIARIQHALELARAHRKPSWAKLAIECGFYDQAHFIRHFKSITGLAPSAYFAERTLKLSET